MAFLGTDSLVTTSTNASMASTHVTETLLAATWSEHTNVLVMPAMAVTDSAAAMLTSV
jgi:hypothetical protein